MVCLITIPPGNRVAVIRTAFRGGFEVSEADVIHSAGKPCGVVVLPHIAEVALVVNFVICSFCKCHIVNINGFGIRDDKRCFNTEVFRGAVARAYRDFCNLNRREHRVVRHRYSTDAVDADGSDGMVQPFRVKPCDDRIVYPPSGCVPGTGVHVRGFRPMLVR